MTTKGETGAVLLAGGPIIAAFSYWWLVHTWQANLAATKPEDLSPDWIPMLALIGSVAATSIGLVMVLTGRGHIHEVEVLPDK